MISSDKILVFQKKFNYRVNRIRNSSERLIYITNLVIVAFLNLR